MSFDRARARTLLELAQPGEDLSRLPVRFLSATTHQYGAKQGQHEYSIKTHSPIPWGDIPPRPFLAIQD